MATILLPGVTLQELTTTEELEKFKSHQKLIPLLVCDAKDLTVQQLVDLAESEIYCSLSVSIHDELVERLDHLALERRHAAKEREVNNA